MTKFIVNKRTDALKTDVNLFFTITNCQIVRSCSLTRRINYKCMCLSALLTNISNKRARISAVVIKKIVLRPLFPFLFFLKIEFLYVLESVNCQLSRNIFHEAIDGLFPKSSFSIDQVYP